MPIPVRYLDSFENLQSSISDDDIFIIVSGSETYNITGSSLINYIKDHPEIDAVYVNEEEFLTFQNRTDNPHNVTKSQVGLGSVDNTADSVKNVLSATRLTTSRKINGTLFNGTEDIETEKWGTPRILDLTGDVFGSVSIDGSNDISLAVTLKDDSHNHTDATLPSASSTVKGVTKLEDSVTSTSASTAATPNSVKQAYDKANSVEQELNAAILAEKSRAESTENNLSDRLNAEINRATGKEDSINTALSEEATRAMEAEKEISNNLATEISRAVSAESAITDKLSSESARAIEAEQNNTDSIATESARAKAAEESIQATINVNKPVWDDKYTRNEVDNKFSAHELDVDWKESVSTYADISKRYPDPDDGWTVNVKDTNYTYRWSGTEWIAISANAIPKATQDIDGLLSKEDKILYDDANSKKHEHGNKSIIDKITQTLLDNWNAAYTKLHEHGNKTILDVITQVLVDGWNSAVTHISDSVKHITSTERTNWDDANSKKHTHSNKTVLDTITQTLIDTWNKVTDKVDKVDGKGLSTNDYTTAEKNKLAGIATGAQVNTIETIQQNGTSLTITDKTVNIIVPTTASGINAEPIQTAATQAEAEAGTGTIVRSWTPQRIAQAARGTILTGLSTATNAVISVTDTVLLALGKLQKQITDHKSDVSNPHSVTKSQVGLGNVQNIDTTNPTNIIWNSNYKTVTDEQIANWNVGGSASGGVTGIKGDSESTYRTGNVNLTKSNIGLGNVTNYDTTNASNISNGTLAAARLPSTAVLTDTAQTISGAKTITGNTITITGTITPSQLGHVSGVTSSIQNQLNGKAGLNSMNDFTGNNTFFDIVYMLSGLDVAYDSIKHVKNPIDNTDATNKQYVDTQVATKQSTLVSGTNIKTINGNSLLGSGNISIEGGGSGAYLPLSGGTMTGSIYGPGLHLGTAPSAWDWGYIEHIQCGEIYASIDYPEVTFFDPVDFISTVNFSDLVFAQGDFYSGGSIDCRSSLKAGMDLTASSLYTQAFGLGSIASSPYAQAFGLYTTATNFASCAIGKYNKAMTKDNAPNFNVGTAFVIGNGTSSTSLSNAFRVTYAGAVYGLSAFNASGADYAEFVYEWADENIDNEDRVGYFVTFKDKKLYKAKSNDIILGIISGCPSVVGNADEDYYWKYERDYFGRVIWEDAEEEVEIVDPETNEIHYEKTGNILKNAVMKISDKYDPEKSEQYIERKDRKEWDYVGMTGVISVRDDGSCIPGQYCKCNNEGIATLATNEEVVMNRFTYVVLERVTDNIIKVLK